ncbi:DUF695 domain-containing protein [Microbacterium sulfonylureivorans]|uniref:DUF695 domain-containing protein n=1 Tax=Microbacterium sulfonylureivorans TaxID=2486854 RepID=UPI000FD6FD63|nr:DUF695 domain-containing protein [Microbacterium sulfonylureivorans]
MLDELNRRVMAINDGLAWHFSAGSQSEHRLTVSAGGQAEIRPLAERWLRAAPAADGTWEFRASQEPQPDALSSTIEIGDERVNLSTTGFRVRPHLDRMRVDVGVYHPQFGDIPEAARMQISFLLLDWLLGEDDVERWLGEIEALTVAPPTPSDGSELLDAVAALTEQRDRDEWVLAHWQNPDGYTSLASFRRGVRWIDYPVFDQHLTLTSHFTSADNGLPADAEALDSLRELEDGLEDVLHTRGVLIAHDTTQGRRAFHVYVDGEDQNTADAITAWADKSNGKVHSEQDPAWSAVRPYTG